MLIVLLGIMDFIIKQTESSLDISAACLASQSWPALRTTFGAFLPRPRTAAEAEAAGWQLLSSCSGAGPFLGARYGLAEDNSIILIYDAAGYIAGTQVSCDWRRAGHVTTVLVYDWLPPSRWCRWRPWGRPWTWWSTPPTSWPPGSRPPPTSPPCTSWTRPSSAPVAGRRTSSTPRAPGTGSWSRWTFTACS